jgi:hypothetical protein
MSKKDNLLPYYIGGGLVIAISIYLFYSFMKNSKKPKSNKAIIIGDSQTPYIAKQSSKAKLLGATGGESVLWKGGQNLKWLFDAVKKYPVTEDMGYVVISIGTNGGFNTKEDIPGLISELKRVFPNAKFLAVKGSWGWGGNTNKTETQVNAYYDIFRKWGVEVLPTPIGAVEPHGDRPSYKKIGAEIDAKIK